MAQAIAYSRIGDPDVLEMIEIPQPEAGSGELVVRIEAAGVNPIDAKLRSGGRPSGPITEPRRVGADGAGVVTAVGPEVRGFRVGDRVAIAWGSGTYATEITVDATRAAVLPEKISFAEGAAIGIPAGTAYQSLRSLGVTDADVVLVHGGSGAVGQFAVQFARAWGATVIATASTARHDRLRDLGAIPVTYGEGLAERVRAVAPGPITVALDCVGTDEALHTSIELVADRNRIGTIVRGADADGLGIRAFQGGSPHPLTEQESAWRAEALAATVELMAEGAITVDLAPSLPLTEAVQAHRIIETGRAGGKIVLIP